MRRVVDVVERWCQPWLLREVASLVREQARYPDRRIIEVNGVKLVGKHAHGYASKLIVRARRWELRTDRPVVNS